MNQHFTVQKKAIFVRKKFLQRGSPKKKIPAQAVSEKKKKFVQAENSPPEINKNIWSSPFLQKEN